jgi:opacity protein-like surface antigen
MKKLLLALFAAGALSASVQAGPEPISGKEMKETVSIPPPAMEWYGDKEWNVSVWGTYAFCGTDYNRADLFDTERTSANGGGAGTWDRFLGHDHAWGGGIDAKYFFHRYFGIGVEGFGAEANESQYTIENFGITAFHTGSANHVVGAALGTLTLRCPIGSSRFSPYLWAGGGGIFGGRTDREQHANSVVKSISHEELSKAMGQFGGGLEIRMTRHVGWISDFSWCVLDGPNNNFGMARTGLNFVF